MPSNGPTPPGDDAMGSALGVAKKNAARIGLDLASYQDRIAAGQKWCTGCKVWHLRDAFGVDRSRTDGLAANCRGGRAVNGSGPGARDRRLFAAIGLAWCRGCKAWLPLGEVMQGACRPHLNEEARGYYAANPGPTRARKSARIRNLAVTPAWWRQERFEEFGGLCAYGCGQNATALDHVWPVGLGGQSRPDNLVPACTACNSSKKAAYPGPWLRRFGAAFPEQFIEFCALNYLFAGHIDNEDVEVA